MLNQIVMVGRLYEIKEINNGYSKLIVSVPRSFKNSEGIYENDFITFLLKGNILENTLEYCKKGDIIGIKGRIQSRTNKLKNGEMSFINELIVEKLTFLTSRKED